MIYSSDFRERPEHRSQRAFLRRMWPISPAADVSHVAALPADPPLTSDRLHPATDIMHISDMSDADLAGVLFDDAHHILEPVLLPLAGLVRQHADIRRRLEILDAARRIRVQAPVAD